MFEVLSFNCFCVSDIGTAEANAGGANTSIDAAEADAACFANSPWTSLL